MHLAYCLFPPNTSLLLRTGVDAATSSQQQRWVSTDGDKQRGYGYNMSWCVCESDLSLFRPRGSLDIALSSFHTVEDIIIRPPTHHNINWSKSVNNNWSSKYHQQYSNTAITHSICTKIDYSIYHLNSQPFPSPPSSLPPLPSSFRSRSSPSKTASSA